jgi:hypothetical protein
MRYQFVIAVNAGTWDVPGALRHKLSKSIRSETGSEFLNMVVLRLFVLRYTHRPQGELLEN